MAMITSQPAFQLLDVLAQLQVEESAKKDMLAFFEQLNEEKRARLLTVLQTVDEDIARLVVATVPKMRAALDGTGAAPAAVIADAVKSLS